MIMALRSSLLPFGLPSWSASLLPHLPRSAVAAASPRRSPKLSQKLNYTSGLNSPEVFVLCAEQGRKSPSCPVSGLRIWQFDSADAVCLSRSRLPTSTLLVFLGCSTALRNPLNRPV